MNVNINNRRTNININNATLDIERRSTPSFIVPTLLQPAPQQAEKSSPGHDERPRLPLRPRIHRHVITAPGKLVFSTFNIRSVNKKVDAVKQLIVDTDTDILCVTEICHEDADAVCIKQFLQDGLQVLERARPFASTESTNSVSLVNHGGVAFIASSNVRLEKLTIGFESKSFELLCARVTSCSASCIDALLHRPGSVSPTAQFFDEFSSVLERLMMYNCQLIITGDVNIRLDRSEDASSINFTDVVTAFGLTQRVDEPTRDLGEYLMSLSAEIAHHRRRSSYWTLVLQITA